LFVAGLKEDIRAKVMEANMPTVRESLRVARDTEVVYNDRKNKAAHISKIEIEANNTEEEDNDINIIRGKDGKFQANRGNAGTSGGAHKGPNDNKPKFDGNCRYCNKYGHSQKYCNLRRQRKAPMVDAKGVPYKPRVHSVQEQDRPTTVEETTQHFNSLNW
jgi:hypothetical protein